MNFSASCYNISVDASMGNQDVAAVISEVKVVLAAKTGSSSLLEKTNK